ncbi:MAG: response regulator [Cellvibrionaceae bacterium]
MFTEQELKIVIDTLKTRKAWLLKSASEQDDNDKSQKNEASAQLLNDAIKKIQTVGASSPNVKKEDSELNFSKLRVLIADDDADSVSLLKDILGDIGVSSIEGAEDGIQALKKIFQAEKPFHLVLCDWNMPGKNGTEVHDALNADKRFKNLAFIMVSAESGSSEIKSAIQQGVDDFIVKPIDADILKKKITKVFNQRASKK